MRRSETKRNGKVLTIIRWSARVLSIAYLLIFLPMFIGEVFVSSDHPMDFREMTRCLFVFAYFAGLILAWKWEGLGALIVICSIVAYHLGVELLPPEGLTLATVPGLLFLACWYLFRDPNVSTGSDALDGV